MWQDYVFTTGQLFFMIALVPTIRGAQKPETSTSLLNTTVLLVFAATHFSLQLWFASVTTLIVAGQWLFLFWQRVQQNKSTLVKKTRVD